MEKTIEETIRVTLNRSSVCAGDDVYAPHTEVFDIPADMSIKDFVLFIREKYLEGAWMANWIVYKAGMPTSRSNEYLYNGDRLFYIDTYTPKIDVLSNYIETHGWPRHMYLEYKWDSKPLVFDAIKTIPLSRTVKYHSRREPSFNLDYYVRPFDWLCIILADLTYLCFVGKRFHSYFHLGLVIDGF